MSFHTNNDQQFLKRLTEVIETNLTNEHFSVRELAIGMGMSHSQIHRKLKSISGKSASQFIREYRLEKAKELLTSNLTISEVAYQVGFGSPTYFNKCFHDYFGYPPGEEKKRNFDENAASKKQQTEIINEQHKNYSGTRKKTVIGTLVFVCLVLLIAVTWFFYYHRDLSIIVLPFENFSDNEDCEHFAEGIREDILSDLYRIADLRVISRTSADQFRNSQLSARQIARKMKVKYVLEGSVRWYDDKIRISTQLINAFPFREDHVWAEDFDRMVDNFIGVQDEIALQVASNVKATLSESEIEQIKKTSTQSAKAYDYYMRARVLLHKADSPQRSGFDKAGVMNCLKYYELAIAEDENFAEAYAGLANANFKLTAWKFISSNKGFLKARELCLKALEIDPYCAEAHCILGAFYIWGQRKFEEGRKEYETSIRLNPNFATAQQGYAQFLMITGPIEKAREHVNHALELEPHFWVVQNLSSWIYYFEEKYEEALDACTSARDYNPNFSSNNWLFVLNYAQLGEGEKMMQELQSIAKKYSQTDDHSDEIRKAYKSAGINGLFLWMIETNKHNPIKVEGLNGHPFFIAWWYAIIGNREEAIQWLEKVMLEKRIPYHYFNLIATNPDFDILRHDPRFLKIIDDIGLAPYHNQESK